MATQELDSIRKARRSLDKLRTKLTRPTLESLDSGASDVLLAVECLQTLESRLRPRAGRPRGIDQLLAPEIRALRHELNQATELLEAAARFYQGWGRLMNPGEGEVTAYDAFGRTGVPGPVPISKVVLRG